MQGSPAPIIDVHMHFFAADVLKPLGEFVAALPDEVEGAVQKLGLTASVLSPVIWSKYNTEWPASQWADLCRNITVAQAAEVAAQPSRRGSFAPLPLPHVDETLATLRWCEEEVSPKPDGYAITTSADNVYLGDARFAPLMAELNRRKALLFVHPSETVMPPLDSRVYGFQMIEFPTETARCLMTMVDQGTFTKYPDIQWVFSHSGGTFPFVFQRVVRTLTGSKLIGVGGPGAAKQVDRIAENNEGRSLQEVFAAGNINFECSQGNPAHQTLLKSLGLGADNVLSGTDWPFTGKDNVEDTISELLGPERSGLYTPTEVRSIRSGNALRLLPRLQKEWAKIGLA